jgi:hypothetical protein
MRGPRVVRLCGLWLSVSELRTVLTVSRGDCRFRCDHMLKLKVREVDNNKKFKSRSALGRTVCRPNVPRACK